MRVCVRVGVCVHMYVCVRVSRYLRVNNTAFWVVQTENVSQRSNLVCFPKFKRMSGARVDYLKHNGKRAQALTKHRNVSLLAAGGKGGKRGDKGVGRGEEWGKRKAGGGGGCFAPKTSHIPTLT